ncbi:nucleoside diphosphate kinase [Lactarius quietus]|nr:nucleoside diphosphate kinase [Lactarius quietus]
MSEQNLVNKDVVGTLVDINPTRTVAIIKPHALDHRFEIEHRITEAKFEIVKERQMEFDVETDPEALFELFGEDARSFAEGPVWVYVLERRRAIEVWNTIMGDPDPQIAREQSPSSLRALYGITRDQNAIIGSPDVEIAEIQIASLFVSSPPFPTSELPEEYPPITSGNSAAGSSATNGTPQRTPFKAREIPLSHDSPTIVPRTTRAADLRAGVTPPKIEREHAPRTRPSKAALQKMFADVPGHKRTESIAVASTAPPVVAPRMTRAASLRISGKGEGRGGSKSRRGVEGGQARTFEGVPGHKRRESFSVASTRPPAVSPRQNRSAALRLSKDTPPPTSYQFKSPVVMSRPSLSRSSSSDGPYSPSYSRRRQRKAILSPRAARSLEHPT